MKEFNIGDTVMCPPADNSRINLDTAIGVISMVEPSEVATVNSRGEIHFYHPTELELIMAGTDLLKSVTQQGVDLVDRAIAR